MANALTQKKWRNKNRFVKRQLNVMAREHTHDALDSMATAFDLRGKGEAVAFACYVARALVQRAEYSEEAAKMLEDFATGYHNNRDLYST